MGDLEDKANSNFNPLLAIISPLALKKDLIHAIKESPKNPMYYPGEKPAPIKERSEEIDKVMFKHIRRALKRVGQEPAVAQSPNELHHEIANRLGGKSRGISEYEAISQLAKDRGWVDMTEAKDSPNRFISEPIALSGDKAEWSSELKVPAQNHPSVKVLFEVADAVKPFTSPDLKGVPVLRDPAATAGKNKHAGVEGALDALYEFGYHAPDNMTEARAFKSTPEPLPVVDFKPKKAKRTGKLGAAALVGAILGSSMARNPIGSNEDK